MRTDRYFRKCKCGEIIEDTEVIRKVRTQALEKVKEKIKEIDIITFLGTLKDFTIDDEHPFGTCDYMNMDYMIKELKLLSQLEDDEVEK